MTPSLFLQKYFAEEPAIERIADRAAAIHAAVNQTYGHGLPYAFHLRLTASFVTRFAYLLPDFTEDKLQTLYAAAYFHDSIEDARLTYNDLVHELQLLNDAGCAIDVHAATEAVYALTNEKGRTRAERADERYYAGIRSTPYASFLKMCDRLANVRYTTLHALPSRMHGVYLKELPHFLEAIEPVPAPMVETLRGYLNDTLHD